MTNMPPFNRPEDEANNNGQPQQPRFPGLPQPPQRPQYGQQNPQAPQQPQGGQPQYGQQPQSAPQQPGQGGGYYQPQQPQQVQHQQQNPGYGVPQSGQQNPQGGYYQQPQQPGQYQGQPYGFNSPQPPKKKNGLLIGGLIAAGVFVIVLVLIIASLFGGAKNRDTAPGSSTAPSQSSAPGNGGSDSGTDTASKLVYPFSKGIGADNIPRLAFSGAADPNWKVTSTSPTGSITYSNSSNQCSVFLYQTYIDDVKPTTNNDDTTTEEMIASVTKTFTKDEVHSGAVDGTLELNDGSGAVATKEMSYAAADGGYNVIAVRGFTEGKTGFLIKLNCADENTAKSTWKSVKDKVTLTVSKY
jgi:hypothetical protein